jgi:hypothetical protein
MSENEKIERLWEAWSKEKGEKRSFAEYFSDEHGMTKIPFSHLELVALIDSHGGKANV